MNSFSSLCSALASNINPNSTSYLLGILKPITLDICGTDFSGNSINLLNQNNTYLRFKYNGALATTPNFATANSFTIYTKTANRFNGNSVLGHGYTLVASVSSYSANTPFTVTFYSLFQVNLPYTLSGGLVTDISGSLTGTIVGNYQPITFTPLTTTKSFTMYAGNASVTILHP